MLEKGELKRYQTLGDQKYEALGRLTDRELERLQELNDLHDSEYSSVDSKAEARGLETERMALYHRCGHDWKHDYQIFGSREQYDCQRCYAHIDNEQEQQ